MSQIVLVLIHQPVRAIFLGVFQISFMKMKILGFHCHKYPQRNLHVHLCQQMHRLYLRTDQ